jgi:ribosomal protein L32
MAIVVLALLFVVAAAAIAYPLLSRQASIAATAAVTDRDIERAVRRLRTARGGLECPTCGHAYRAGDRFCVKCGADLPAGIPAAVPSPAANACPECGVLLRPGDVFCSKCGHRVAAGEER